MSGWTIFLLIVALIYWVLRGGFKRLKEAKQRGDIISYQAGSQERNWALALAHPMAYHAMQGGFASDLHGADDALARQLRPMILHHLGLRTDLSDEQVRQQLPDALRQRWFMLDLQRLQRSDDVRAAMAFACARVTFFVRSARLLEWTDEALHWDILQLNAQRAQQCFDSWLAFGQAYAQGRAQWLAQGRSDVLGKAFTTEEVAQWVTQEQHPWHAMSWNLPLTGDEAKPASEPAA
ncbi:MULTISPECIES: DUF1266 domain-containing protein [Comamonas]|uniref:DUF1266 domain-containing protein n=1 Tax=Comamonas thiooxydans TaxID=363952 RepID=A0AA42TSM9_9BURK|nr:MULTISPECIES: DUF1266 domain-containing protein [Comamonas]ACY34820.1 hypothetical protein CtCNB1_4074 [Comamonas thiooxydans]EFI58900.1 hypothetical protein CTS44_24253 [Comamonas thiooxydans]MDH1333405.1 DUF1266 domain-containing protein [Comamonas thiooxydans]MDH1738822.1 DUF1266 domain-containing protein [Comamonas thiooxydans]MDH1788144.1 DUF1266 domain-containing protein [Comamonas thiooxydans]